MKKIIYTSHLEFRIKIRRTSHDLPKKIYSEANEHYYDSITGHYIAIAKHVYEGKLRDIALTYDNKRYAVEMITVHPIKPYQKHSRISSGRWRKL